MTTLTIIPARLAATRLPNKPLADICGTPMILHVAAQAVKADLGPVIIASGDEAISQVVRDAGFLAFDTPVDLPSGTDRVFAALQQFDPQGKFQHIINLQGDLPTMDPVDLQHLNSLLGDERFDMVTLACPIDTLQEQESPHVVKAVLSLEEDGQMAEGIYFTRKEVPSSDGRYYHHIGVYGFQRQSLKRYVDLPPAPLERFERLEQLRFLENGMRVGVSLVEVPPYGVDTKEDLERICTLMQNA